jgi:hypothetical protein
VGHASGNLARLTGRGKVIPESLKGPPVRAKNTHLAFCHDCRLKHGFLAPTTERLVAELSSWNEKHRGHKTGVARRRQLASYGDNANVKQAFDAEVTMTTTNLQSLASSPTAGWSSVSVDNTSNLYEDVLVQVVLAAVNTAPANDKAVYVHAFGGTNATDLTTTGTSGGTVGTEGALTFPSIATPLPVVMPLIGVIPYPVQNKAITGPPFSVAAAFGGILPPFWGVAILNYTGMTLASSGNTVKYRPVYHTVI